VQATDFPGRGFLVEEVIPFKKQAIRNLHITLPKANITVRNFPIGADDLRKRLKIADGGDTYIFATTLHAGEKVLLRCIRH
jgi:hypothetical protein